MASTVPPNLSVHRQLAERVIDGLTSIGAVAVAPDGEYAAFTVTRVSVADNEYRSEIWLASLDGSTAPRNLTAGPRDDLACWSPDGSQLAFTSRRHPNTKDTTIHVLPVGVPGEVRTVAAMPDGVGALRWSPDGRWLGFTSRVPDERYAHDDTRWQSPRKIETFLTRLDDVGWVFDRPQHVHVVPVDASTPPVCLTDGPFQHQGLAWLADSSGVVTSARRHEGWDRDLAEHLYLVPLAGPDGTRPELRQLTSGSLKAWRPAVSPDGSCVAFVGYDDATTYPRNARVGVVELRDGTRTWVSQHLDRHFDPTPGACAPVWIDDRSLMATAEDRGHCHLYLLDRTGQEAPHPLTVGDRWLTSFDHRGGATVFGASRVRHPGELFVLRDQAGTDDELLVDPAPTYTAKASPRRWERFSVPCRDGSGEIDAWIMTPDDLEAGERRPVLLNVHGGPHTQYGEIYFDEAQLQAAAGFVVIMSNPRGSSGREESWGQAILGPEHHTSPGTGWGGADVDDVLAVLDAALERYEYCDPDRVGMLGGSYGGWMATEFASRHGHRFRAICSERAVNNLLSAEWSSDIAATFWTEIGPNHLAGPEQYVRMSPVTRVHDIHTPMLLLHSEEDWRCPIVQAEELFVALRLLGRDVTFYRFPGEGHELSRKGAPLHRVQRAEIILDFFARLLRPDGTPAS